MTKSDNGLKRNVLRFRWRNHWLGCDLLGCNNLPEQNACFNIIADEGKQMLSKGCMCTASHPQ